ncbi:hypothetical protein KIP75_16670, partial [Pseudomonas aeruginosa]|nr:hypothetical protein [Pseudomonas aeruginosa]
NGQQGRVSAKGLLDANLKGLDQRGGGVLVSETGVTLDLNGGTLVNRDGGLIAWRCSPSLAAAATGATTACWPATAACDST